MTLRLKGTDYHAVVFDSDGVLVDSEHAWGLAEAALCDAFDVEYTAAVASQTTGVGLKDAVSVLLAAAQHPVDLSYAYQLMRDLAEAHVPPATHPIPDAQRVVQLLGSLLPIGVASNSEQPLLDRILAKIGLADEFHAVVSASEVDAPKPAPDVYVLSAERLEVHPHHTIVVEDSHTGVAAARSAGCYVIGFGIDGPLVDWSVPSHLALLDLLLPAEDPALPSERHSHARLIR